MSEVKKACYIIEQRISPEILCDFEKLFFSEGSVTLDQTHVSLYHLWHDLKTAVVEKKLGKVATVVTSRIYADNEADFSSTSSSNKTPSVSDFSSGTITAPKNIENIALENFQSTTSSENSVPKDFVLEGMSFDGVAALPPTASHNSPEITLVTTDGTPITNISEVQLQFSSEHAHSTSVTYNDLNSEFKIPSPFKKVISFPNLKRETSGGKLKRKREAIPFAITSSNWKKYHTAEAEKKVNLEREKEDNRRKREEK